ncbi:MAG: ATP synthase F1 subunit gamma [Persicimonas sp.]
MPSLKDIKTRIGSVKNTQKITRAMKMVAAAKLNRAQGAVEAARPYAHKMQQVISNLVARSEEGSHPLLEQRESVDRVLVFAIASDRGLCGGFNSYLCRGVESFIADEQLSGEQVSVAPAGRKARDYFRRSKQDVDKNFMDVVDSPGYAEAKKLAKYATDKFLSGEYDAVYVGYNEFVSAIEYNTLIEPVLPLSKEIFSGGGQADQTEQEEGSGAAEYIYEPDEEKLLEQTLPSYVEVKFLQALLESFAAEQGARMTAMDNATNNADDMISSLTQQYNRARQAYITREICEIVSGAESLQG